MAEGLWLGLMLLLAWNQADHAHATIQGEIGHNQVVEYATSSPWQAMMTSARLLTEEYDLILTDWKKGQKLDLKHSLFTLDSVSEGGISAGAILFTGKTFGHEGQVSITFYDMEGNGYLMKKGQSAVASVDQKRTTFSVGAIVPAQLRGREGIVQVSFRGKEQERAAFQLKVKF
ncbi:hypothetical protein [Brevibacillus dissolubilis]|uniref:hypothetical protein n=1 Tax=Brevibacillus dissolubilis TaxID=1844116 RepID=UPI0011170C8A|nr:hypothetical protein [Brevibacillus dissolubilis]